MSLGLTAIEVDTWLQDDILLAGHELKDLSKGKTVKSIYLDPLFKMLERANNPSFSSKKTGENDIDGNDEWDVPEGGDDDDVVEDEDDEDTEERGESEEKKNVQRAESNTPSKRLRNWNNKDWKGVFPLSPKQELMLMIDVVSSHATELHIKASRVLMLI